MTQANLNIRKNGSKDPAAVSVEVEAFDDIDLKVPLDETDELYDRDTLRSMVHNLPPWHRQFTLRGLVVGLPMGVLFTFITLKLSLGTAGIVPGLGIPSKQSRADESKRFKALKSLE
jgi:hypothetical protein